MLHILFYHYYDKGYASSYRKEIGRTGLSTASPPCLSTDPLLMLRELRRQFPPGFTMVCEMWRGSPHPQQYTDSEINPEMVLAGSLLISGESLWCLGMKTQLCREPSVDTPEIHLVWPRHIGPPPCHCWDGSLSFHLHFSVVFAFFLFFFKGVDENQAVWVCLFVCLLMVIIWELPPVLGHAPLCVSEGSMSVNVADT